MFNLKVYTPNKLIISEIITKLRVDGKEGSFTILPAHIDYITSFDNSIISFINIENKQLFLATNQGILTKVGKNVQISVFNIEMSNTLDELKSIIKTKRDNFQKDMEIEKNINNNLKSIEFAMFNKILKFKRM